MPSISSPFPHFGPLAPAEVRGRESEARELGLRLVEHRPTALLAPRRFGKTSLVGLVLAQLEDAGAANAVRVDLFGVTSYADFAARLDRALATVTGPLRRWVDTTAAGFSVRLGVVGVDLRRKQSAAPGAVATCHALLEVLTGAAERGEVAVAFDEFSDIARVDGLDGLLRSHLQLHYGRLGLVFAGSSPSMMRELFGARDRPFFSQAEVVELGPLDQLTVTDLVHDGFGASGRHAGPLALRVWAVAGGHPQRTMQLADAAWQRTPAGASADEATWAAAFEATRAAVAGTLAALYGELSPAEGPVLRSVARTGSAFSASESRFHDLSNSSITGARNNLVRDGHLIVVDGKVRIVDPLLADWLLRTFP